MVANVRSASPVVRPISIAVRKACVLLWPVGGEHPLGQRHPAALAARGRVAQQGLRPGDPAARPPPSRRPSTRTGSPGSAPPGPRPPRHPCAGSRRTPARTRRSRAGTRTARTTPRPAPRAPRATPARPRTAPWRARHHRSARQRAPRRCDRRSSTRRSSTLTPPKRSSPFRWSSRRSWTTGECAVRFPSVLTRRIPRGEPTAPQSARPATTPSVRFGAPRARRRCSATRRRATWRRGRWGGTSTATRRTTRRPSWIPRAPSRRGTPGHSVSPPPSRRHCRRWSSRSSSRGRLQVPCSGPLHWWPSSRCPSPTRTPMTT